MKRIELILCGMSLVVIVQSFFAVAPHSIGIFLPVISLILLIIHLRSTSSRWQMLPIWVVLIVTQVINFAGVTFTGANWIALFVLCAFLTLLSLALVLGMPLVQIPVPDGPYGVGSVTHTLEDIERARCEGSSLKGRQIFVKVWYPAKERSKSDRHLRESLWQELQTSKNIPRLLRWLTAYLKTIETNTFSSASFAAAVENPPLLIYNHGMVSFSAENTLLMEHLASHGFVIVSIRHLDQLDEFQTTGKEVSESERTNNVKTLKRLASQISREERATLSLSFYQSASATNRIVHARAMDTGFVLDHMSEIAASIPASTNMDINSDDVGLLGLSLGGAVATEFSKTDQRCGAVVNMDGGLFGTRIEDPIRAPYLMLYSAQNEGCNDLLLKKNCAGSRELTIPKSKHLDFHDAVMVLPIMRWMGALGSVQPREMMQAKNQEIRNHFETFLGSGAAL